MVHTSPSGPCTAQNVQLSMRYGLGEESEEELGTKEDLLLLMGERGGGPGVPGLCPVQGGGIGMATDREGGAKEERNCSVIGSPFPLQDQQRDS